MRRLIVVFFTLLLLCFATLGSPCKADTLGAILAADHDGRTVIFHCSEGSAELTPILPGLVRVEIFPEGYSSEPHSELVVQLDGPALRSELEDMDNSYLFSFTGMRVEVAKEPFSLAFSASEGAPELRQITPDGIEWHPPHYALRFVLEDDHLYGLGQPDQRGREQSLDLRGYNYPIWNRHFPPSRLLIPFIISSRGYGLFFDNPWRAVVDTGETFPNLLQYEADGGPIRYYVILGEDTLDILEKYTALTGRPPMPPLWTLGFLQSKWGYRNREEVESLADTFREKGIPCDGIIIDLFWFRQMGDLDFDEEYWPRPAEMIGSLREQGFHVIVIEEPYVTTASHNHEVGLSQGIFATDRSGEPYVFQMWRGPASLVDFSKPEAREWWIGMHERLVGYGIEGWWIDLNEPETDFHDMVFAGGPAAGQHNLQALLMQGTVFEALRRLAPEMRPFILSRSSFAGSQRYGTAIWSGDVRAAWQDLARQVVLGQNCSMAGLSLWNSDIGGFWGNPTPELYLRWLQFGLFTPICRPHGAFSVREPWQFGAEVERIATEAIKVRYSLIPYIYSILYRMHMSGKPLMRPTFTLFPDDNRFADRGDPYLFGDSLLVAPVTQENMRSREVHLPAGNWYNFWTGERYAGGRVIQAQAPLEHIPVFARAGAIIPRLEPMQHSMERPWDHLILDIFAGADGSFTLYEDDGITTAYLNGAYSLTRIEFSESKEGYRVEIGAAEGEFPERPEERSYLIRIFGATEPSAVLQDNRALARRDSMQELIPCESGWWYDREQEVLFVSVAPAFGALDIIAEIE